MLGEIRLPKAFRPNEPYRKGGYGVDLPREFCDRLKHIDPHFHPVFHAYMVLSDSIINTGAGELEDTRWQVHREYGELIFGFAPQKREGGPAHDNTQSHKLGLDWHVGSWHIWRWSWPHGVAHIVKLESLEPRYLDLVLRRLFVQQQWTNKYGFRSYNKLLDSLQEKDRATLIKEADETFAAIQEENMYFMRRVMDNFERGIVQPTNPTKETIMSYGHQSNRSRIIRPLEDEDRESGLILPGR